MDHPDLAASPHLKWFRGNKRQMLALAIACTAGGAVVAWPYAGDLVKAFWPVALIGLLYVIPLTLTGGRTIGLRRVPGMKAFLVAFAWAAVTVGLPHTIHDRPDEPALWEFVMQFAFFLSLAIAFDVRDLPFDMKSLRTLPQLLGATGAKFFAVLFQLPWMLFLVTMALLSLSPIEEVTPRGYLLGPMLLPFVGHVIACVLIAGARPDRSETYSSVGLDGTLILIPLLGWLGSLL